MKKGPAGKNFTIISWAFMNFYAWLSGFVVTMLVIFAMEGLGIGNQSAIGIGMGAAVGFLQGRYLQPFGIDAKKWFLFTFAGLGISYILYDVIVIFYPISPDNNLFYFTLAGALVAGWLQWKYLLKSLFPGAVGWIAIYGLGWFAAHVISLGFVSWFQPLARNMTLWVSVPLTILIIICGGLILGFITGPLLARFFKKHKGVG